MGAVQGTKARPDRRRRRLGPATVVAVLIHLQLGVMLGLLAYLKAPRNRDLAPEDMIAVTTLSDEASRALAEELDREQAEQEKKQEEEKKKDEEKPDPNRQVVDIPTPRNETAPKEARYAAEHDSTVEQETHRRGTPITRVSPSRRSRPCWPCAPPVRPRRARGPWALPAPRRSRRGRTRRRNRYHSRAERALPGLRPPSPLRRRRSR